VISALTLTRQFGARLAVDAVSFTVNRSEIVALLGPNGAGKTTTLRMLAGLIAPTRGSVAVDEMRMTRRTAGMLRARIGFLTETPGLWDRLSVRENLQIYAALYPIGQPKDAVDRALDTFDLTDRASTRAAELSKGMRQKVALARALLHNPTILLLDEPMSGLDPEITRTVRTLLEERRSAGCAILMSTHNLDEAERMADRVAVLDRKLLALDRPAALRGRLTTGRVIVRLASDAGAYVAAARSLAPDATADDSTLILTLGRPERDTPELVRALVRAGADVLEVRPEIPALEDVYLHLLGGG
jgi:ABC-2 type transport system ATP-binding protein